MHLHGKKENPGCSPMINSTVPEDIRPINPIRLPRFSADLSSSKVTTETLNTVVFAKDPQPRGNLRSFVMPLSTDTKAKAANQQRAGREQGPQMKTKALVSGRGRKEQRKANGQHTSQSSGVGLSGVQSGRLGRPTAGDSDLTSAFPWRSSQHNPVSEHLPCLNFILWCCLLIGQTWLTASEVRSDRQGASRTTAQSS